LWKIADSETLPQISDLEGYRTDFNNLFGFKVEGVNYQEDVNEVVEIPGLVS
jgi:enoyl-[acyl-carrier protein] reductase/trans-2-enoyl-CoA reductase (NAD+)